MEMTFNMGGNVNLEKSRVFEKKIVEEEEENNEVSENIGNEEIIIPPSSASKKPFLFNYLMEKAI